MELILHAADRISPDGDGASRPPPLGRPNGVRILAPAAAAAGPAPASAPTAAATPAPTAAPTAASAIAIAIVPTPRIPRLAGLSPVQLPLPHLLGSRP